MTFRMHKKQSHSQVRKPRAHTQYRTSHAPPIRRARLPLITQTRGFPLGGAFRLGLD